MIEGIQNAILPGGRFVADLFGDRFFQPSGHPVALLSKKELIDLFKENFIFEKFEEKEYDAYGIHWHRFYIIAKKKIISR